MRSTMDLKAGNRSAEQLDDEWDLTLRGHPASETDETTTK